MLQCADGRWTCAFVGPQRFIMRLGGSAGQGYGKTALYPGLMASWNIGMRDFAVRGVEGRRLVNGLVVVV